MKKTIRSFASKTIVIAVLLSAAAPVFGQKTTVQDLNPAPPVVGVVNAPNNVGNANFITLAAMTVAVSNAFNANLGGVINWEGTNGFVANGQNLLSQTVSYGVAQSKSLTITLSASTFGPTTLNGSLATTSGTNYLGFQTASPNTLNFSTGLISWGMTELNRASSRTVTFSFTLADNSVVTYNAETQDPAGNNSGANNWFGFQATEANPLMSVTFTVAGNGFTRFDDMAFVAVPEPGTMALAVLGGLSSLALIRRRKI